MGDPTIKNELTVNVCATGAAPQDDVLESAMREYGYVQCEAQSMWLNQGSSFEFQVVSGKTKIIDDVVYYCKNVNVSFFCQEPKPEESGHSHGPSWENGKCGWQKGGCPGSDAPKPKKNPGL